AGLQACLVGAHLMAVAALEHRPAPSAPSPLPPDETTLLPRRLSHARPLFDPEIVRRAIKESFRKLDPRTLVKNPVMFVVEVGAALTTVFVIRDLVAGHAGIGFGVQISMWLWF